MPQCVEIVTTKGGRYSRCPRGATCANCVKCSFHCACRAPRPYSRYGSCCAGDSCPANSSGDQCDTGGSFSRRSGGAWCNIEVRRIGLGIAAQRWVAGGRSYRDYPWGMLGGGGDPDSLGAESIGAPSSHEHELQLVEIGSQQALARQLLGRRDRLSLSEGGDCSTSFAGIPRQPPWLRPLQQQAATAPKSVELRVKPEMLSSSWYDETDSIVSGASSDGDSFIEVGPDLNDLDMGSVSPPPTCLILQVNEEWPLVRPQGGSKREPLYVIWGTGDLSYSDTQIGLGGGLGLDSLALDGTRLLITDGQLSRHVSRVSDMAISPWWHVPTPYLMLRATWAKGMMDKLCTLISRGEVVPVSTPTDGNMLAETGRVPIVIDAPIPARPGADYPSPFFTKIEAGRIEKCWYDTTTVDSTAYCRWGLGGSYYIPTSWQGATFVRPRRLPDIFNSGHARLPEHRGHSIFKAVGYTSMGGPRAFIPESDACMTAPLVVVQAPGRSAVEAYAGWSTLTQVLDGEGMATVIACACEPIVAHRAKDLDFYGATRQSIDTVVGNLFIRGSAGLPVTIRAVTESTMYGQDIVIASLALSRWMIPTGPVGRTPLDVLDVHDRPRDPDWIIAPYHNTLINGTSQQAGQRSLCPIDR